MARRHGSVVVLGASAGGVSALSRLLADLPSDLGAPVLVVLHTAPASDSFLPEILARAGPLPVHHAENGERLEPNEVYVAPPDHHLMVVDGFARVVRGPHENGHRPAIDPLFRSAAVAYRERTVAVVLTGALDDGSAGAAAVSRLGGSVLVQDPEEAAYPDMPRNVILSDHPLAVLPVAELAEAVVELVRNPPVRGGSNSDGAARLERDHAMLSEDAIARADVFEELISEQSQSLDAALAAALRALEEHADLARRMGRRLRNSDLAERAGRYDRIVEQSERDALVIRQVLLNRDGPNG